MSIKVTERYAFTDAAQLREFLNQFEDLDLSTVYLKTRDDDDTLRAAWEEETLTGGSVVHNLKFT